GGVAVGARLRAEGVAEGLVVRAHRRRTRRTLASAAASVAVLALAGTVAVELLRPPPDPAGPVHRDDVPSIDRIVNPEAADLFQCGVEPTAGPEQGVTIADDADRDAHPDVEVALFERYVDASGEDVEVRLPVDGSVAADPDAALVFATMVAWGEDGPPETWGVSTAGAVLGDEGTPVMIHDGVTVRGDLLPVVEQLRALEGGFDAYACGEAFAGEGEHTVLTVVQVWEGDPGTVVATYVNPGWGDDAAIAFADRPEEITLGSDDAARREQGALAHQVAREGVPLTEAGGGYASPALTSAAQVNGTATCVRAQAAPTLDSIRVIPTPFDSSSFTTRLGPVLFDNSAGRADEIELVAPLVSWTGERPDHPWVGHQYRSTLLIYDDGGVLVAVFEGDGTVGIGEGPDAGTVAKVFQYDAGCAVPSEWPRDPGVYSAVYAADLLFLPDSRGEVETVDALGLVEPPDGWFLMPEFEIVEGEPPQEAELVVPPDRASPIIP
ncbi:hypothetical protein, partial [Demequina lignilytica]